MQELSSTPQTVSAKGLKLCNFLPVQNRALQLQRTLSDVDLAGNLPIRTRFVVDKYTISSFTTWYVLHLL